MSCPTCGHTMQHVGETITTRVFWCKRCGTLRIDDKVFRNMLESETPKLVERCREFRASRHPSFKAEVGLFGDPVLAAEWERLGIAESINVPERRT